MNGIFTPKDTNGILIAKKRPKPKPRIVQITIKWTVKFV